MWHHLCYSRCENIVACFDSPPKPVYPINDFIVTFSGQLKYISNHPHSFIFVMGDFNMFDTGFLCNYFGFDIIVMAATHGKKYP